jgi:hypothetical protein
MSAAVTEPRGRRDTVYLLPAVVAINRLRDIRIVKLEPATPAVEPLPPPKLPPRCGTMLNRTRRCPF